jgi:hypothetical protein
MASPWVAARFCASSAEKPLGAAALSTQQARPMETRGRHLADRARILFFFEDRARGEPLVARLTEEGFEVTGVRTFLEAAWSLTAGHVNLFLIYLPETVWVRNVILTEVRRANPKLPILALAPVVSNELSQVCARFHVVTLLPATDSWQRLVDAIYSALGSYDPARGGQT